MLLYIIDRFEGDYAVIEGEDRRLFTLPKNLLSQAQAGDVIEISVTIDVRETEKRKKQTRSLLDNFFDE